MYLVFDVGGTTVKYAYMNNMGEIFAVADGIKTAGNIDLLYLLLLFI